MKSSEKKKQNIEKVKEPTNLDVESDMRRTTTFPAKSVAQLRRSVKFRRAALPGLRRLGSDLVSWGFNGDFLSGLVVGFVLLPEVILIYSYKIYFILGLL